VSQLQDSRFCPHCERRVRAVANPIDGKFHAAMCLLTCGLYFLIVVPVMFVQAMIGPTYRCVDCGAVCRRRM
jgi:hypothetical protein